MAAGATARRPLAGLIALVLLAACPLYYGHMFINAKDGPFAVTMAIVLLGIVRAFEEYPHATPATVALCGVGVGLAVGSRVMGGFAVFDALLPLLLIVAVRSRERGLKPALAECGSFLVPFVPAAILAYFVMGLVWPWSVLAPLNPFRAADYFSDFFEKPWRELFDGQLILVTDMPRSYVPTLAALKLPELLLALGLGGTVGAIVAAARGKDSGVAIGRRAALIAIVLAATLPILVTILARPAMYNGIRHFVFTLPPFAVLGGLAGAWIAQRLERYGRAAMAAAVVVLAVGVASPAVDMVRLHPFEYTHFNRIAGGVAGARPLYMLDYWGLSLTQASRELRTLVVERHETPRHRNLDGRSLRPASAGQCCAGPAIYDNVGPQRRRLRHEPGRVLLRQARCAGPVRDRTRRRRLCACLRHSRPFDFDAAHGAGVRCR